MASRSPARPARPAWVAATLLVLTFAVSNAPVQPQSLNTALWKSLAESQKVANKIALLMKEMTSNSLSQFRESATLTQSYVHKWGDRVVAGDKSSSAAIGACLAVYDKEIRALETKLEGSLSTSDASHMQWYDGAIFGLFTMVGSEQSMEKVVKNVQSHLKNTQDEFRNVAISSLKEAVEGMQPCYQKVSRCIRDQFLRSESATTF